MEQKLILRTSNGLGNQLFMYASAICASKKINKQLFLDSKSGFLKNKKFKFLLNNFNISAPIAEDKYLFLNVLGRLKRKYMIFLDHFNNKKKFIFEKKIKSKRTFFDKSIFNKKFDNIVYMEGYFESEKYFLNYKQKIKKELFIKNSKAYQNNPLFREIINTNSICLCIRQNRFEESIKKTTQEQIIKSNNFVKEQLVFIKQSINFFKTKYSNPKFYLWSNNLNNLKNHFNESDVKIVDTSKIMNNSNRVLLDFYLMTQCKSYAVIPSSFNWWGAWLRNNDTKGLILRPKNNVFKSFEIKNKDYWPDNWLTI